MRSYYALLLCVLLCWVKAHVIGYVIGWVNGWVNHIVSEPNNTISEGNDLTYRRDKKN